MGEAVLSCEGDEMEMEMGMEMDEVEVCDGRMVKRERFSPRMALRVLLVEADDSTRQVIAALLRKCSYKVAAVSDGLKAWEVLKGKPNSVDLILTEVELPSISGFALLTLIMEHDSCKNIPVIMMSSNDSVNMVYKCMLRGAADFLVKPVRKNELQNLWQHVWRRQSQKAEGLSDNDVLIDLSNGACTPENEECNEKGNDAQSSCSVRDLEAESAYTETMQGNLKANFSKLASCDSESDEEERVRGDPATLEPACVVIGSSFEAPEDAVMMIQQEYHGGKKHGEASDNNDAFINGSREAIDLIGNFQDHSSKSNINSSVITCSTKFDFCPRLDLSLRRYDDSKGSQYIAAEERRQAVHQSTASAFSRYVAMQPSSSHNTRENTTSHQPGEEHGAISDKHISSPVQPSNFDVYDGATELRQGETSFYCPQARMLPVTVPVKSVRLDRTCPSNGSSLRPSYYQTGSSPDSSGPRDNGGLNRLNSSGGGGSACGSNGSGNGNPTTESKADGISTQDRSLQREAALTKFRQKRKDRCFEKKVRYESRKKLAEQRPRVKGQFVRQVPADLSSAAAVDTR